MPRLSKRFVEKLEPTDRDFFAWDAELRGFGVRIFPSGTRKYLVQWKRHGRTRRFVLGAHGPITCEQARNKAREILGRVAIGDDPAAERDEQRSDPTIAELAERWLRDGSANKRQSTLAMDKSRIEAHVKPLIGNIRLKSLTRTDVEHFVRDVTDGKTARSIGSGRQRRDIRGGAVVAARTLGMLSAMLQFAVVCGLCDKNPAQHVRAAVAPERERPLSLVDLARLGEALEKAESRGESWQVLGLIRLLALTGLRRDEARTLKWTNVDFGAGRLTLPATKTGRSYRPLAGTALDLLSELRQLSGNSEWVFPATRGVGPIVGVQKVWARIRAHAGLDDVRLHDLRHNLASVAVASGESLYITGKVIGHAKARSTERYAHLADDPLRAAADRAATQIADGMSGKIDGTANRRTAKVLATAIRARQV